MLSEVEFQDHEFLIVCPYVFVSEKKGKKWKKLPILITLIYCNFLSSCTLVLMNGGVEDGYMTQRLASLMYPN